MGQSIHKLARPLRDTLPDKDGVEHKCVVVILGKRDDEAAIGQLQAATARHLDRWTDVTVKVVRKTQVAPSGLFFSRLDWTCS